MKLDYDLIRSLLLMVEEDTDGYINCEPEIIFKLDTT